MEKQFVSHSIALQLEELGFDEECLAYFNEVKPDVFYIDFFEDEDSLSSIKAPLWQQAIDFFREKFGINICINCVNYRQGNQFEGSLSKVTTQEMLDNNDFSKYIHLTDLYATYEEAREQAILKAVELCKNKKL